jgi:D-glycero-D-manno-heptose 1,7-bisphosphate phosphatase
MLLEWRLFRDLLPMSRLKHGNNLIGSRRENVMFIWIKTPKVDSRPFLLLDRDGVINEDRPDYIRHRREYQFYPDALQALRWLREHQIHVVLISNQSGLGRGLISWEDFWDIHEGMLKGIQDAGGNILGACYCPHRPEKGCTCRKPLPGMIQAASELLHIPLAETHLIGDRDSDLLAASRAGCQGALLDRFGSGTEALQVEAGSKPVRSFASLMEAVLALSETWKV